MEQQQSEKVAETTKSGNGEASVVELMQLKASFLLKFAGCVKVESKTEVIFVFCDHLYIYELATSTITCFSLLTCKHIYIHKAVYVFVCFCVCLSAYNSGTDFQGNSGVPQGLF